MPKTGPRNAEVVVSPVASNQPLLARQNQEMGVGRHHPSESILVFSASLNTFVHLLHKMPGDVLNVLLATRHESQRPHGMSLTLCTVAVWLSTAQLLLGKGTRKQVFRKLETPDQFKLALTNSSCFVTFRANL
jgi:hypothetical protein